MNLPERQQFLNLINYIHMLHMKHQSVTVIFHTKSLNGAWKVLVHKFSKNLQVIFFHITNHSILLYLAAYKTSHFTVMWSFKYLTIMQANQTKIK